MRYRTRVDPGSHFDQCRLRKAGLALASLFACGCIVPPSDASTILVPEDGLRFHMIADARTTAIEGRVSIRPVRSVERRGVANSAPFQASIAVIDTAGKQVAMVQSDAEGKFRVELPPGTYVLRPLSPATYPRASEQRAVVRRDEVTQVDIVYDSGRR